MLKNCAICGKEFETGKGACKVCSDECRIELKVRTIKSQWKRKKEQLRTGRPVGRPKKYKERKYRPSDKETKCWSCQNACGGCSWSKKLKPVRGWKADKIKIKLFRIGDEDFYTDSYFVRECPKYIMDE